MQSLKDENFKLKEKIKTLEAEIEEKNSIIQVYERDWALKLSSDLDAIFEAYSLLVNPIPVSVRSTFKNQSYTFEIKVSNIIGIFAKGRTKQIILHKPTASQGSSERVTNIIEVDNDFDSLIILLERNKFHLCQVNRSCLVNVKYYNLKHDAVELISSESYLDKKHYTIKISTDCKAEFISRKEAFENISSLQKNKLRYILNSITQKPK